MFTSYRSLARRLAPALVMSLVLWVALVAGAVAAFGGGHKPVSKVTICHATGSENNPYVRITVSVSAFHQSGHVSHGGDVWAAFSYVKQSKTVHVPAQGDQSLLPDCVAPEPTPEPTPTDEPTDEPTGEPSPEPTETPDPEPTPTPEPTPEPEPSPSPSPEPTSEPSPTPTPTPEPEPTETPEPTPGPTDSPDATPTPSPSAPAPDDDELDCPEGKAPGWLDENGDPTSCVDDDPTPWPDPIPDHTPKVDPIPDETPDDDAPEPGEELAETGTTTGALAVIALVLLVVGVGITYLNYRSKKE